MPKVVFCNLAREMKKRGITQADMSKAIETPLNTLGYWLRGHGSMPLHKALEIRDRLFPDLTVEYLFRRE